MPERMIFVSNNQIPSESNKRVYNIKEIASILNVSERHAYNFCNSTAEFEVIKIGKSIRVKKDSFDKWFDG